MDRQKELFFDLIRVSVGTSDNLRYTPTEAEWSMLFEEANRQTLTGVLLDGIRRLPSDQCPPRPILMNWHATSEVIAAQNRQLNKDTVWVSQKWAQKGYNSIILKGQGNALLYPNPLRRASGDIDIWLDGKRDEIASYIKGMFPKEEVTLIEMNFPVKKGTSIEVHFQPSFLYNPFSDSKMQHYYKLQQKNPKTVVLEGEPIQIPSNEMNLVFQLSHIYRHLFFEGIGLRQLMDYYYLLHMVHQEHDASAIETAKRMIEEVNLLKFCKALMWVEGEVFGLPKDMMLTEPDEKEGRFLLREVMQSGNFGHDDERVGNWAEMNRLQRLTWGTKWAMRLIRHYPQEVLWHPAYRIKQYVWRLWKGYL